jgi:hypothetical protein
MAKVMTRKQFSQARHLLWPSFSGHSLDRRDAIRVSLQPVRR